MFIVTNRLSVKNEYTERLESAFDESYKGIEDQPGFIQYRLLRPQDAEKDTYVIETTWTDEGAFFAWKQSDHFRQSHANMVTFREAFYAPPQLGQYTVVQEVEGKQHQL